SPTVIHEQSLDPRSSLSFPTRRSSDLAVIYGLLLVNAVARTFEQPVMQSLVPVMAPRAVLGRAIAAHVSGGRLSMLLGPSLGGVDRKSTRLNSSHVKISYAVFCLKKKN